jgi:hypothetical protein
MVFICIYAIPGTAGRSSVWHTLVMAADDPKNKSEIEKSKPDSQDDDNSPKDNERSKEIGGRGGLDPTRYGDWEKGGRCIDF